MPLRVLDQAELLACCGSRRWAAAMAAAQPFADVDQALRTAETIWERLGTADWLAALAAHPAIGDATASGQASREQSGALTAGADVRGELAAANRTYRERFGYLFVICASGKSGAEMLAALRARLGNAPEDELAIAADQQRQITRLRLERAFAE